MAKKIGFTAFWINRTLRDRHYKNGDFNIVSDLLPNHSYYLDIWNRRVNDQEKMNYQKIEEFLPNKKSAYVRFFSYYWFDSKFYHTSKIISDKFRTFKKYEAELENIKDIVYNDFVYVMNYCESMDLTLKQVLISKNPEALPLIIDLYFNKKISVNSFLVFNSVFNVLGRIDSDKLLPYNLKTFKRCEIINNKYKKIVYNYFTNFEWKDFLFNVVPDNLI